MVIIFQVILGLSVLFVLIMMVGWNRIPIFKISERADDLPKVSILIPVRNEAKQIGQLLIDLAKQSYPNFLFEVIVIDDGSEDTLLEIVHEIQNSTSTTLDLKVIANQFQPGKKGAIETGIFSAKYELIVSTDGDCRVQEGWLLTLAQFLSKKKRSMIVGPVRLTGSGGFLQQFQIMEFAALQGIAGATLNFRIPTMCNGANLAYLKSSFNSAGGFADNIQVASGDDEFLMHKIWNYSDGNVEFLKNPDAIVETSTVQDFSDWWSQRKRWASKWKSYEAFAPKLVALAIFIFNVNVIFGWVLVVLGILNIKIFVSWFLLKTIIDYLFVKNVNGFLSIKSNPLYFILMELLYPLYTIIFGLAGLIGGYSWKGRKTN